jgi:hypothetical protein
MICEAIFPIMLLEAKLMTKSRWSLMPYPANMMEALHSMISEVAQTPSISFDPRKNVVPTGVWVNSPLPPPS